MKFSNRSLSSQLAIGIAGLCLVVVGSISIWNYRAAERASIDDVEGNLTQNARMLSAFIESVYRGEIRSAERLMNVYESVLGGPLSVGPDLVRTGSEMLPAVRANGRLLNGNLAVIEEMERRIGKTGVGLQIIHNGQAYRILTTNKDENGNYRFGGVVPSNDPLAVAARSGNRYEGLVFRDGKPRATVGKPFADAAGKPLGVLAITLDVEGAIGNLAKQLNEIKVGQTGYVYALARGNDGDRFVIHPSLIGKSIDDAPANARPILQEIMAGSAGTVRYMWPDRDGNEGLKLVAYQEVPGLGWKVASGSLVREFTEQIGRQAVFSALLMSLGLAAIILALVLFIRSRLQPIRGVLGAFDRIAKGDLTAELAARESASHNEIDLLANHARETIQCVRNVVTTAKTTAQEVHEASRSSREAAKRASEIAVDLGDQAHAMASSIEQVSVAVDHVAESSVSVSALTGEVSAQATVGAESARQFHGNLSQVAGDIDITAAEIRRLGERSVEIGRIIEVIQDIANQTNLLALNAAIEAARAGEAGRGFAVVADEVRKLADVTTRSAGEIREVVKAIQSETENAVGSIGAVAEDIRQSTQAAADICGALDRINTQARDTAASVQGISDATKEQSAAIQQIAVAVEHIARLSEESSHHSQESLTSNVNLNRMSRKLDETMQVFVI